MSVIGYESGLCPQLIMSIMYMLILLFRVDLGFVLVVRWCKLYVARMVSLENIGDDELRPSNNVGK
jgi:hypothetical protein